MNLNENTYLIPNVYNTCIELLGDRGYDKIPSKLSAEDVNKLYKKSRSSGTALTITAFDVTSNQIAIIYMYDRNVPGFRKENFKEFRNDIQTKIVGFHKTPCLLT